MHGAFFGHPMCIILGSMVGWDGWGSLCHCISQGNPLSKTLVGRFDICWSTGLRKNSVVETYQLYSSIVQSFGTVRGGSMCAAMYFSNPKGGT